MGIRGLRGGEDWQELPKAFTEQAKGTGRKIEPKNNRNTKPPSRGKGGSTGKSGSLGK